VAWGVGIVRVQVAFVWLGPFLWSRLSCSEGWAARCSSGSGHSDHNRVGLCDRCGESRTNAQSEHGGEGDELHC
jgi:hypothetical protein